MLRFNAVTFSWPKTKVPCIKTLSFHLNQGEQVALVGENGAGKSTVLKIAAGLIQPEQGHVLVNNVDIATLHAGLRAESIGLLFQEPERQIFHNTVWEEVAFGLRLQKYPKDVIQDRVQITLDQLALAQYAQAHPLDLDAGQKRMVAVASLAVLDLSLLLLDEPSRDFDGQWLEIFETWLATCRKKEVTVLAISHDTDFVARNFSRVIRLHNGTIAVGT